jgi:hypothetical protein
MAKNKLKFSAYLFSAIILTLGLSISFQSLLADFTPPSNNPPTCPAGSPGCDVPLNVGPTNQQKQGMLLLNTAGNTNGLIVQSGRVGIGTISPGYMLHVNGNFYATTINTGHGNNELYAMNQNVRITDSPQFTGLNIGHASDTTLARTAAGAISVEGNTIWTTANDGSGSGLNADLLDGQHGNYYLPSASVSGTTNYISKFTSSNTLGNSLIYDNGTNVGIGTTAPGYKLHVNGTVYASTYYGGACDIAERYNADDEEKGDLEPGDILSLSRSGDLKVGKSKQAYDTMVIGVFSTDPMLTMGEFEGSNNEDNPPVALLGRVPTKVTNENGAIEIGDLIVSSSKEGHGMKCDEYSKCQGAIVGKALENFNGEEGIIEVLINVGM